MIHARWIVPLCAALSAGCSAPTLAQQHANAAPAVEALQKGSFDAAAREAGQSLAADPDNPQARLVRAIVRYQKTMRQLSLDVRTLVIGGVAAGGLNHKYLRTTFEQGESELASVETDLAAAAKSRDVSLELCLACWDNVDWTGDGRVNARDSLLLQIERDAEGQPIPEGDPRRKPTFRFDDGDVAWARAFVGFERAGLDVVLAYDWSGIDELLERGGDKPDHLVLRLAHRERIADAKERLLEALAQSDEARRSYLAETDDDREWVPSPRQQSHPMPLPVDQALYDTWEGVVGDLARLVRGEEGLGVAELAKLAGEKRGLGGARGFIDVGGMLSHPRDITLSEHEILSLERSRDAPSALKAVLGEYYVPEMRASPLPGRLARMKGEIDGSKEEIEHKLRYLFWLN